MDNTNHKEGCPFASPRVKKHTQKWFEYMGIKNNCIDCEEGLEFSDES